MMMVEVRRSPFPANGAARMRFLPSSPDQQTKINRKIMIIIVVWKIEAMVSLNLAYKRGRHLENFPLISSTFCCPSDPLLERNRTLRKQSTLTCCSRPVPFWLIALLILQPGGVWLYRLFFCSARPSNNVKHTTPIHTGNTRKMFIGPYFLE